MKRGTLADRALMSGVLRIARQRGLAKRQVGSVADVITAWRVGNVSGEMTVNWPT